LAGVLLVVAGVVGYFAAVIYLPQLPSIRNYAWPNWLLIAAGLAAGVLAVRRLPRRWTPKVLLGAEVALAGLFAAMLYVFSAVPPTGGPAVGSPAPDFTLTDNRGDLVHLADLRGAPVLLVFYRGHW
jgi:hypothetical protein